MKLRETDRVIQECSECQLCVDDCEFLRSVSQTPKELAEGFHRGSFKEKPNIPYSCNLCGLCRQLCPEELDVGHMCLEARQHMVKEGMGPLPGHQRVIQDQEWALSEFYALTLTTSGERKHRQLFFPGCSLSAYSPELVINTYQYLRSKLPETGIILGCCGAPSHGIGDQSRFQNMLNKVTSEVQKAEATELIVACPDCYHVFKENAPHIRLKSIYELIAEQGLPANVEKAPDGEVFTIHDSCKTRHESNIQDNVRNIVQRLGYEIEEMKYSRDMTRCCGMGGMAAYIDPRLVNRITTLRAKETSLDILVYCASCRDAFALAKKPCVHILELVFNPMWEKMMTRLPALGESRHKNQSRLREQLLEESTKNK